MPGAFLACPSAIAALDRPTETSLNLLIAEYGWGDRNLLDAVTDLGSVLEQLGLDVVPMLGENGLDDVRVLRRRPDTNPADVALGEIARGEGPSTEFKETLYLDTKKHILGKKPVCDCRSDEVLHSSLKTIAAFLNTKGGTLLIGVTDAGTPLGVSREYELTCPSGQGSFDHWELFLRGKIEQHFLDGKSVSSSVSVQRVDVEGSTIARLVIGRRNRLSVVRKGDAQVLYIRDSNRTVSVQASELDDFFRLERRYV